MEPAVITAGVTIFGTLTGGISLLFGLLMKAKNDQLADCLAREQRCDAKCESLQGQIDAIIENDLDRAREKRATDYVPALPPKASRRKLWIARILIVGGALMCATGFTACAYRAAHPNPPTSETSP